MLIVEPGRQPITYAEKMAYVSWGLLKCVRFWQFSVISLNVERISNFIRAYSGVWVIRIVHEGCCQFRPILWCLAILRLFVPLVVIIIVTTRISDKFQSVQCSELHKCRIKYLYCSALYILPHSKSKVQVDKVNRVDRSNICQVDQVVYYSRLIVKVDRVDRRNIQVDRNRRFDFMEIYP